MDLEYRNSITNVPYSKKLSVIEVFASKWQTLLWAWDGAAGVL